jgi:uncharacterized membrane protein
MVDGLARILTLVAAVGTGLVAGIFFAFSSFVMRALDRLPAAQGIAAMQSINVAVINPLFMTTFLGTGAACTLLVALSLWDWHRPGSGFLLSGGLLYLVGTILVTIAFNVPRNEALAHIDPASADAPRLWSGYVAGWTAWNHVRTVAALSAALFLTLAHALRPG